MPRRRRRRRTYKAICENKTRYESRGPAMDAVRHWRRKRKELRAYFCDNCKGYHLSSR